MALAIFGTAPSRTSAHPPSSASLWLCQERLWERFFHSRPGRRMAQDGMVGGLYGLAVAPAKFMWSGSWCIEKDRKSEYKWQFKCLKHVHSVHLFSFGQPSYLDSWFPLRLSWLKGLQVPSASPRKMFGGDFFYVSLTWIDLAFSFNLTLCGKDHLLYCQYWGVHLHMQSTSQQLITQETSWNILKYFIDPHLFQGNAHLYVNEWPSPPCPSWKSPSAAPSERPTLMMVGRRELSGSSFSNCVSISCGTWGSWSPSLILEDSFQ